MKKLREEIAYMALNEHGGARPGAGRPKGVGAEAILKSNKVIERKLKSMAEMGFEVLADNYPNLMRTAVDAALGVEGKLPNMAILKTLLELMVKVAGVEPDDTDSIIKQLVGRFIERSQESRNENGSSLASDGRGSDGRPDRGYTAGSDTGEALHGMEPRFHLPGSE